MPDIKRKCTDCGLEAHTEEDLNLFVTAKRYKHGHKNLCKECSRVQTKNWTASNLERKARTDHNWYENNKDYVSKKCKNWRKNNHHKVIAKNAKRRASQLQATPSWANHAIIEGIYAIASRRGQHVDHIVPLINDLVCGLHVEDNLQLLEPIENLRKGNTFHV